MSSLRLALAASLAESRGNEDGDGGGGSGSPSESGKSLHHVRRHKRNFRREDTVETKSGGGGGVNKNSLSNTTSTRSPRAKIGKEGRSRSMSFVSVSPPSKSIVSEMIEPYAGGTVRVRCDGQLWYSGTIRGVDHKRQTMIVVFDNGTEDDLQFPDSDVVVYPSSKKKDGTANSAEEVSRTLIHSECVNHHNGEAKASRRTEESQDEENASTNTRKQKYEKGEKAGLRTPKNTKDDSDACNTAEEETTQLKGQRVKDANETRTKRRKSRPMLKSTSNLSDEFQSPPRIRGRKKSGSVENPEEVAGDMDTGEDVPSVDETTCSTNEDSVEENNDKGGAAAKNNNKPRIEDKPEDAAQDAAQDAEPEMSRNGAANGVENPSTPSKDLAEPARLSLDTTHVEEAREGGNPEPPQPSPDEQTEDVLLSELEPVLRNKKRRRSSTPSSTSSSSGSPLEKDKLIVDASKQTKQDEEVGTERPLPDEMEENGSPSMEAVAKTDLLSVDIPSSINTCEAKYVSAVPPPSPVLTPKSLLKEEEGNHVTSHAEEEGNGCLPQLEQQPLKKMRQQLTPKLQPLPSSTLVKKEEACNVDMTPVECDSGRLDEPKLLEVNEPALVKKQGVSSEDENLHIKSDRNDFITSGDGEAKGNAGTKPEPEDVTTSCEVKYVTRQQPKPIDSHELLSVLTDEVITCKEEDFSVEPQGDVSEALKLPASTSGKEGGNLAPPQHQSSRSAEVCPRIQCNQCHKWRKLPPHIQASSISEKWVCSDNVWDPRRQSCEVEEEEAVENEKLFADQLNHSTTTNAYSVPSEVSADHWVQCEADHCHKWRRVPASINVETLPDEWFCNMNTWDSERACCEAPEEKDEQPLQPSSKPLNHMPAGRGRRLGVGVARSNSGLLNSPALPPTKPRGRPRRSFSSGMPSNNVTAPPSSPIKWVQCDEKSCKKWRCLPPGVDPKSLPEKWFCSMNTDKRFASCNAPEQLEEPVKPTTPSTTPGRCGDLNALSVGEGRGEYQGQSRGRSYILAKQAKPNGKLSYREIMFSASGNLKAPFGGHGVTLGTETSICGVDEGMDKACPPVYQSLLRAASCYPRCGTYETEVGVRQKVQSACSSSEFISACKILGQILQADNATPYMSTQPIIKQEHVNSHLRMLELDGIVESNVNGGYRLTSHGLLPNSRFMHGRPLKLVKAWRREQG